ncbi:MAG: DASS family sodium-coupled anion symporter [Phycisphaeraceae bacterium]
MNPLPQIKSSQGTRTHIIVLLTLIAAVTVYYILPTSMNELARRTVTIFLVAAVFWATEALPLFATSLCIIAFEILFLAHHGGLAGVLPAQSEFPLTPDGASPQQFSATEFLQSFASPIIILFMGGFLLAAAVTKHGLDRAIASRILRPFTRRPILLVYGVMMITAFFSMWMSNTATTAMMLAIIAPLVKDMPPGGKFHRAVILAVPFGANIGGIGTPIGTPPNAVALAALRQAGYQIGFVDWMFMAVPLAVLLIFVAGALLYWFFPPGRGLVLPRLEKQTQRINFQGRLTLAILVAAIVLWLTGKWHGINPAVVALLAAAALTTLRVLDRRDVDSIDWNILILMWGGLSLGHAMNVTGVLDYVMQLPIVNLQGFPLAAIIVVLAVAMSTFMSNTAAVTLIVPMAMALSVSQAGELAILAALACSFAMAMPVSTPPNAMAFATGKVPVTAMFRAGIVVSVICVVVLLMGYQIMLPLFLNLHGAGG